MKLILVVMLLSCSINQIQAQTQKLVSYKNVFISKSTNKAKAEPNFISSTFRLHFTRLEGSTSDYFDGILIQPHQNMNDAFIVYLDKVNRLSRTDSMENIIYDAHASDSTLHVNTVIISITESEDILKSITIKGIINAIQYSWVFTSFQPAFYESRGRTKGN